MKINFIKEDSKVNEKQRIETYTRIGKGSFQLL
jgi:hypothetical protein